MESKELVETALNALDRLLRMFMIERYVYLALTAVSFLLLIYAAFLIATTKNANTEVLVAVFGSSGLVAASSARISWFFNRAFTLIEDLIKRISK
ncbi:MAG TPA: hypothetical protein VL381_04450 [Rhodocyclaceae bacterium]|nr:hypothetical protein [Rhodocyclaceae bacterium]